MLRFKCCPKPHLLCIDEKKQAMTCYEGFLLLVREVLGATVGCLGAVLGAVFRVKICGEHQTPNSTVLTAISKPKLTSKQEGITKQI